MDMQNVIATAGKGGVNLGRVASTSVEFDLTKLRLSQDFVEHTGVKKHVNTVPVRKPHKQEFVRVHPSEEYRIETMVLDLKEDRETYLVAPSLWPDLAAELTPKVLYTAMNRQKVLTLWPIRMPGTDGRIDQWNASALDAVTLARETWVRVAANMGLGAYEVYEATGEIPEPDWPDLSFSEIAKIAFRGRYIDSLDHLALRRLRGEV